MEERKSHIMIIFGKNNLTVEGLLAISSEKTQAELNAEDAFVSQINKGAEFLRRTLEKDGSIYGVTTGFGDSCDVDVTVALAEMMPKNLYTFHGCGTGSNLSPRQTRLVLAVRLASLCRGVSGVRYDLLLQLFKLLKHNILPIIPEEGSVGASGDLTPLSYVAAVLCGEREVFYQGKVCPAAEALADCNIQPLTLKPKEGLAIMNGTAVMTGMAAEAYSRASYLSKLCSRITALATVGLGSNNAHFAEFLFNAKPHPGQGRVAERIRHDLQHQGPVYDSGRLQERYSIRCAPHVIGVLEDILPWYKTTIETEVNSANDNPIIDPVSETIHHGGHFYGGHIAFVMDGMKNNVANLSDLLDRQMALMVDVKYNHGLPRNLSGADADVAPINHGFKAVQIACSAWTAEALKLTMPASVFSRSTESHNQDKVSMGTIAARDCLRVLTLAEQTAAAVLMASVQAIYLRIKQNELIRENLSESLIDFTQQVANEVEPLANDRRLEHDIKTLQQCIENQKWALYD